MRKIKPYLIWAIGTIAIVAVGYFAYSTLTEKTIRNIEQQPTIIEDREIGTDSDAVIL